MASEHKLKLLEPYFSAVLSGSKTFEVRRNDRAYQAGDTLVLMDHSRCDCGQDVCARRRPSNRARIGDYVLTARAVLEAAEEVRGG